MAEITRETLEMAALAAGHAEARYEDWPGMEMRHGYACAIWTGERYINPAEDDGDAARLAAAVGMKITAPKHRGDGASAEPLDGKSRSVTVYREDKAEQMRVAITLCAAAAGERMQRGER